MVDLSGVFRRARDKSKEIAVDARARGAADELRRTAGAVNEVLDERTHGSWGAAVAKGGEVVDRVAGVPGQAKAAFRDEARDEDYRPEEYRPDPIDAPAPIDRPEPL